MRTGTEPNMGKQEGNTGRWQKMSPRGCDSHGEFTKKHLLKDEEWSTRLLLLLFSHLADAFVQSDLQMRAIEAIKTNKKRY